MKLKLFFAFLCAVALNSCSSNNDNNNPQNATLEGGWRLTNVSGGLTGTNDSFSGEITWTFNADGTVSVWNTNTDNTKVDLLETGDYTYAFMPNTTTPETCAQAFYINGISYGCQNISGNTMTLSQIETDGYLATLEKIELITNQ